MCFYLGGQHLLPEQCHKDTLFCSNHVVLDEAMEKIRSYGSIVGQHKAHTHSQGNPSVTQADENRNRKHKYLYGYMHNGSLKTVLQFGVLSINCMLLYVVSNDALLARDIRDSVESTFF